MNLSPHFTLEEFTTSIHRNIDNTPSSGIIEQLGYTALRMEEVRNLLGFPITVNSAYRCLELNTLIGSKPTSQHIKGQAVDFTCKQFGTPKDIVEKIKNSSIVFDQLIFEFESWVHISFVLTNPRRQILTIDKKGTRLYES